jgi:hypothetical protein
MPVLGGDTAVGGMEVTGVAIMASRGAKWRVVSAAAGNEAAAVKMGEPLEGWSLAGKKVWMEITPGSLGVCVPRVTECQQKVEEVCKIRGSRFEEASDVCSSTSTWLVWQFNIAFRPGRVTKLLSVCVRHECSLKVAEADPLGDALLLYRQECLQGSHLPDLWLVTSAPIQQKLHVP